MASAPASTARSVEGSASTERSQRRRGQPSSRAASACDHGIVRIDGGDELAEEALDPLVVGALLGSVEREPVLGASDARPRGRTSSHRRPSRVRRVERQPELLDEPEVRGVCLPDELAAELHRAGAVDGDLLDPPSDPVARLEHEHVGAAAHEIARSREPGEPGADGRRRRSRRHRLVVGEDAQRVRGKIRGDGRADVVLLDVTRVRDERLHAVAAREHDEHLRRRAEVDEALDRRRDAVLAGRRGRLDADPLGSNRQPHDAGARCPCSALRETPPTSTRATVERRGRA